MKKFKEAIPIKQKNNRKISLCQTIRRVHIGSILKVSSAELKKESRGPFCIPVCTLDHGLAQKL